MDLEYLVESVFFRALIDFLHPFDICRLAFVSTSVYQKIGTGSCFIDSVKSRMDSIGCSFGICNKGGFDSFLSEYFLSVIGKDLFFILSDSNDCDSLTFHFNQRAWTDMNVPRTISIIKKLVDHLASARYRPPIEVWMNEYIPEVGERRYTGISTTGTFGYENMQLVLEMSELRRNWTMCIEVEKYYDFRSDRKKTINIVVGHLDAEDDLAMSVFLDVFRVVYRPVVGDVFFVEVPSSIVSKKVEWDHRKDLLLHRRETRRCPVCWKVTKEPDYWTCCGRGPVYVSSFGHLEEFNFLLGCLVRRYTLIGKSRNPLTTRVMSSIKPFTDHKRGMECFRLL